MTARDKATLKTYFNTGDILTETHIADLVDSIPIESVLSYGAVGNGSTDDTAAIQAAIDACGATGGIVYFPTGYTYYLNNATTAVKLPRSCTAPLVLSGYGATIKLSANTPRAFDMGRIADFDVFQNIVIQGFIIDCNNISSRGHVIFGPFYGDNAPYAYLSYENIIIRDIKAINIPTTTTLNTRWGIYFSMDRNDPGMTTLTYAKNIYIDNVRIEGGHSGIIFTGSGTNPNYNYIDNVHIWNCIHDRGVVPTALVAHNSFFIGCTAIGGRASIRNCKSVGAGDCAFEVNNLDSCIIEDCLSENPWANGYLIKNSTNTSEYPNSQRIVLRNCRARVTAEDVAANSTGFRLSGTAEPTLGEVILDQCSFFRNTATTRTSLLTDAIAVNYLIKRLVIEHFNAVIENIAYTTNASTFGFVVLVDPAGTPEIIMKDIYIDVSGTASGAGDNLLNYYGIDLRGDGARYVLEDIKISIAITGAKHSGGIIGLKFGNTANSLRAEVNRLKIIALGDDPSPYGIYVRDSTKLTILDRIQLRDCDFSGMTTGSQIEVSGATNQAQVFASGTIFMTDPFPAAAVTPGVSPYIYQNLNFWSENVIVQGGTVSKIELSVDGSNYYDTGVIAGAFHLNNADYLRVTYSSVPAMTRLPDR